MKAEVDRERESLSTEGKRDSTMRGKERKKEKQNNDKLAK